MDTYLEMAVQVVSSSSASGGYDADALETTLTRVHETLMQLAAKEGLEVSIPVKETMTPSNSITRDHVTCLECGKNFKLLSNRHLNLHDLTPKEYKQKHGFSLRTPLSCTSLSAKRRKIAKEKGMGQALVEYRENKKKAKRPARATRSR